VEKHQFLSLRFCRSRRKALHTKTWPQHCVLTGGECTLSVGLELKMEFPDRCFRSRPHAQREPIHETCHLHPMEGRNPCPRFFADYSPVKAGLPAAFDIVITNGQIIDGTGSPWYSADIGIREAKTAHRPRGLCARRCELVVINPAQGSPARADRTGVGLLQPEDGCGPTRSRHSVALGTVRFAASEVVTLRLEDLDWRNGLITVRGKGGRYSQLPLPVDVGKGIANYLRSARPKVADRCVFLRSRAPVASFKGPQAIASVVKHALVRAGIHSPRNGAYQFRHGLATQMLRQGASLAEIGELLRHRSPQTTTIYAKVDIIALRTLALPWPGSARCL